MPHYSSHARKQGPSAGLGKLRGCGQWDGTRIQSPGALGPASPAQAPPSMFPHLQGPATPSEPRQLGSFRKGHPPNQGRRAVWSSASSSSWRSQFWLLSSRLLLLFLLLSSRSPPVPDLIHREASADLLPFFLLSLLNPFPPSRLPRLVTLEFPAQSSTQPPQWDP